MPNETRIVESYEGMRTRDRNRIQCEGEQRVPLIYNELDDPCLCDKEGNNFKRFPIVSLKEGDSIPLIKYYANYQQALKDRRTFMRFGRYINKFYPDRYSSKELEGFSADYNKQFGAYTLLFARTSDEILQVYLNGPNSCMSKHPLQLNVSSDETTQLWHPGYKGGAHRYFQLDDEGLLHPVKAYGDIGKPLDLSVAYIQSNFDKEKIVARCVCWEKEKIYNTVYGSSSNDFRLVPALKKLGFTQSYARFEGARLQRIPFKDNFVLPYLDLNNRYCRDDGEYIVIDSHGEINCESVNGLAIMDNDYCYSCEDRVHSDDAYSDQNGNLFCIGCRDDCLTLCCWCDNYIHNDNTQFHFWQNEGDVCHNCFTNDFKTCQLPGCDNIGTNNSMVSYNFYRTCHSCVRHNGFIDTGFKTVQLNRPIFIKLNDDGKINLEELKT